MIRRPAGILAATLLGLAAVVAWAAGPDAPAPDATAAATRSYDPRKAFAEADTNGDGVVDHAEFQNRIVEVFFMADRNKDGYLDAIEMQSLAFPDDFKADDKDADGRVSMREFLRVRFRDFTQSDTNDDGVLSVEEVVAAYEGRRAR